MNPEKYVLFSVIKFYLKGLEVMNFGFHSSHTQYSNFDVFLFQCTDWSSNAI